MQVRIKKMFPGTITDKIFETNSTFNDKQCATGKVEFPFLKTFLTLLTEFSFCQGDWALGYPFMKFRHFTDIS